MDETRIRLALPIRKCSGHSLAVSRSPETQRPLVYAIGSHTAYRKCETGYAQTARAQRAELCETGCPGP